MGKEKQEGFEEVMERREREDFYHEHIRNESYAEPHPDGCFYCGSYAHTSDCCSDGAAVTEYWEG